VGVTKTRPLHCWIWQKGRIKCAIYLSGQPVKGHFSGDLNTDDKKKPDYLSSDILRWTFLLKLESALLTPPSEWHSADGVEEVLTEYGFDVPKLKANLESLPDIAPGKTTIRGIADDFAALLPETKKLFRHLEELLVLLLLVPVSAASAERSFSLMRRLMNYLRTSTGQARLNHLAILHMYKEKLDKLDMNRIMKIFVNNETRHRIFGEIN